MRNEPIVPTHKKKTIKWLLSLDILLFGNNSNKLIVSNQRPHSTTFMNHCFVLPKYAHTKCARTRVLCRLSRRRETKDK